MRWSTENKRGKGKRKREKRWREKRTSFLSLSPLCLSLSRSRSCFFLWLCVYAYVVVCVKENASERDTRTHTHTHARCSSVCTAWKRKSFRSSSKLTLKWENCAAWQSKSSDETKRNSDRECSRSLSLYANRLNAISFRWYMNMPSNAFNAHTQWTKTKTKRCQGE